MRGIVLGLISLVGGVLTAQGPEPVPAADELARRLQAHYATVRDFTADFKQTHLGGVVRQEVVDRGHVRIKKPARMRWEYTSSQKQEMVADGTEVYTYLPDDRKVYVDRLPNADEASSAMLFLTGRGDLLRDFTPSLRHEQPSLAWRLHLVPKTAQADFVTLDLVANRKTLALEGLETTDPSGGITTYTFSNLKENVGLADSDFLFNMSKLPKDVEVIRR